jgi:hypothetical protein
MSTVIESTLSDETTDAATLARKDATVWQKACIVATSRDFPECRSPEKAAVRIMAGAECGIGPIASVMGIRFQNGRMSMDSALMAGVIKRSDRLNYTIVEHTDQVCELRFFEDGELAGNSIFSWDDAKKAKLEGKDVWKCYPRNMLFARALSNGARWYCPGLFNGAVYSHEELGYQVDEEGHAVDGEGSGGSSGSGSSGGSDLCTKEQRKEIREYVAQLGSTEAEWCKGMGIKMLDELSAYEADKAIKGLAKMAAKKALKESQAKAEAKPEAKPGAAPVATTAAAPEKPVTPAVQTLVESFEDSHKPSTKTQRLTILELAERIIPGDSEEAQAQRHDMLVTILAKRNVSKIAELSALQALALIENMEKRAAEVAAEVANEPPFEPNVTSKTNGKATATAR